MTADARLIFMASGAGTTIASCLEAIKQEKLTAQVELIICDQPDAGVFDIANRYQVPSLLLDRKTMTSRRQFETALSATWQLVQPDLIVLLGFMRILSTKLLALWPNRLINLHPSLLPAYPGLATYQQAIDDHATEHGSTLHWVSAEVDAGPIISQWRFNVDPAWDAQQLEQYTKHQEQIMVPKALQHLIEKQSR